MNEKKKPLLVLSVDVEALPARAESDHVKKLIWGDFGDGSRYGLNELMEAAEDVGAKLTCLLDYSEEELYKEEIDQVAKVIMERGHDLQLHLHPEILPESFWARFGLDKPNQAPNRWPDEISKIPFEHFVEKFKRVKGRVPEAFRAGSFRSNPGQIKAMGDLGITISSNQATSVYTAQKREPNGAPSDSILKHFNGVFEIPLTQIPTRDGEWANLEFPWRGRAKDKPAECFKKLSADGRPVYVLLLHSWVLLNKPLTDSKHFEPGDGSKLKDFRDVLEAAKEYFDFTTFGEIAKNVRFLDKYHQKQLSEDEASLMTESPYEDQSITSEKSMLIKDSKDKEIYGIVIGGMRCGSTAAFKTLAQHPEVCPAIKKEVHYFSSDENWSKGYDWYCDQWPDFNPNIHKVRVEATTHYSKFPVHKDIPKRMVSLGKDLRLLYSVRDPIERMESQLTFQLTKGYLKPEDREKFLKGTALKYSMYNYQIAQYLQYFQKSQIFIVIQEQMKNQPEKIYPLMYQHLGLDPSFQPEKTIANGRELYIAKTNERFDDKHFKLTEAEKREIYLAIKDDIDLFLETFKLTDDNWETYRRMRG